MKGKYVSKRKKKWIILSAVVLIAAVGGTAMVIHGKKRSAADAAAEGNAVSEAQASIGTISSTIIGTGTLEGDVTDSITIPSGVVIEEVLAESGDHVERGDILATVEKTSVLSAMEAVQKEIEMLDEAIRESSDDTAEETIEAGVDGRIKKIYVESGCDAADCMIENGALMLLSIDGYMAVDLEGVSGVAEDDDVTVTLADKTTQDGTIESAGSGRATIIFSDTEAEMAETVTVTDKDGTVLGSGEAYIHQQLAVTATGGTVDQICVSENELVSSGTELCVMSSEGHTLEYRQQIARRASLTERLQKLISLSKSGAVTAETSGTISSVNLSAASESVSENTASVSTASGSSSYSVSKMSFGANEKDVILCTASLSEETGNEDAADDSGQKEQLRISIVGEGDCTQTEMVIAAPVTGAVPQSSITAMDGTYTGTINWTPTAAVFAAETCYQAAVTAEAAEGYCFDSDSIEKIETGILSGLVISDDQKTMSFVITFPYTQAEKEEKDESSIKESTTTPKPSESFDEADTQPTNTAGVSDSNMTNPEVTNNGIPSGVTASGGSADSAGQSGASTDTSGSTENSDSTVSSTENSEITAFTLASDDTMILSVNVDELDINSVSEDQEAAIVLDALEDQSFTGTVTDVSDRAESSGGGVSKYSVKITIPKDDKMKEGMNASATIVTEEKEQVVTIPVNALQEHGQEVFVYTEKDEEGNLSGRVAVTTGLSDGELVEIIEGLREGDTVYYLKTGSFPAEGSEFPAQDGMRGFQSGGEMIPGAGEMPAGGGGMRSRGE